MKTLKRAQIFNLLDQVASFIPAPLYWLDTNIIVVGANELCLEATGRSDPLDIFVGKSFYEFHPKDIADELVKNTRKVIETGKALKLEEWIKDFSTGRKKCFETIRAPLFDDSKKVVGVICTAIDITDTKETEQLRLENETQKAKITAQEEFTIIINEFNHILQKHKFNVLNRDLDIKNKLDESDKNEKIHLSPREQDILYYLSMNKSPKAIASILSKRDKTKILPSTIQATINKRMYFKFDVNNTDELIEKASHLNLIPVLLPKRIK